MKPFKPLAVSFLALLLPASVSAAGLTIGVVAPTGGQFAVLGKQIIDGARMQAEASGNTILAVPESCEDNSGEEIAKRLISGGADAAIGFLCSESLSGSLAALKTGGIPAITLSVRSRVLFEDAIKNGWPVFSLAPGPGEEAQATAGFIAENWSGTPFALLDDGTISAHELAANVRLELESKGLAPTIAETFRPGLDNQARLVRKLEKAEITEAYIAASRNDVAVIARDADSQATGVTILGSEALLAADEDVALPQGVQAIMPDVWRDRPEASAVVQALAEKGIVAEGYVLPAHAAAFIVEKAAKEKSKGETLAQAIARANFATVIGPVSFGADRLRKESAYQLTEWRDGAFLPLKTQ
jgi:branched-chain amino acid transport system substrate-binding protein